MSENTHHISSYKQLAVIWVTLLILTAVTVWVSTLDLRSLTIVVAIGIATAKATIVALFFMHLRFDRKILGVFLLLTLLIFVAVLLLTFLDYGFR